MDKGIKVYIYTCLPSSLLFKRKNERKKDLHFTFYSREIRGRGMKIALADTGYTLMNDIKQIPSDRETDMYNPTIQMPSQIKMCVTNRKSQRYNFFQIKE